MHQIDYAENKNQCKLLIYQISPNPATQGYAEYLILNWGAVHWSFKVFDIF